MDTLSTLSQTAKQFYDRALLIRALPNMYLPKIGETRSYPKNAGNTFSLRRINSLASASATPFVISPEGVTPPPSTLSMTEITGTWTQYGNYVQITDSLDLFGIDKIITEATDVLGENGGQVVEEVIKAELANGTNVVFATGSARNQQAAANPITNAVVRRAVRTLASADAKPFYAGEGENGQGGLYIGYIHPRQWFDLLGDTAVLNTFQYSDPEKMYKLNIPIFGQVAWIVTNRAPLFAGAGSSGADVYGAYIFGKQAFINPMVGSMSTKAPKGVLETVVQPIGSAGASDPLGQRGTIGWKAFMAPKIANNNFIVRIESGVSA